MRVLLPPDRGFVRGSARAAVLAEWMTAWLGERVSVELAADYTALAQAIARGGADLAWAPPVVCAQVRNDVHAILTIVRYGATSCRSALVVRSDSGIAWVEELRGRRASWVDPLSTNGCLMALAHLKARGLEPSTLFAAQRHAGSYRDALADVVERRSDVTSVFVVDEDPGATLRELHDLVGPRAADLTLLAITDPAPYDALTVGKTGDPERLTDQLLSLHQKMSPPAMILEVCRADRFVRARSEDYAGLHALAQF